jgi:hypothetical protein
VAATAAEGLLVAASRVGLVTAASMLGEGEGEPAALGAPLSSGAGLVPVGSACKASGMLLLLLLLTPGEVAGRAGLGSPPCGLASSPAAACCCGLAAPSVSASS